LVAANFSSDFSAAGGEELKLTSPGKLLCSNCTGETKGTSPVELLDTVVELEGLGGHGCALPCSGCGYGGGGISTGTEGGSYSARGKWKGGF
jgi:hypothetical protein